MSAVGRHHGNGMSSTRRETTKVGCEFLAIEANTVGPHAGHTSEYCISTLAPCLIDDPLGYINCTRRTWLMLNEVSPTPPESVKRNIRKRISVDQGKLL